MAVCGGFRLVGGEGRGCHCKSVPAVHGPTTHLHISHTSTTTESTHEVGTCSEVAARNFSLSVFSLSLMDARGFSGHALSQGGEGRGGCGAYHLAGRCAVLCVCWHTLTGRCP